MAEYASLIFGLVLSLFGAFMFCKTWAVREKVAKFTPPVAPSDMINPFAWLIEWISRFIPSWVWAVAIMLVGAASIAHQLLK